MMSRIEELRPTVTPRCEGMRLSPHYSDTPGCDKQCKHPASYRIDGKNYCKNHAGKLALFILAEKED